MFTQAKHATYARRTFQRDRISKKAKKRLVKMRTCQHSDRARVNARRLARRHRKARKRRLAVTPYGRWAIPAYIVMCESKGSYTAQNPSGAYGAYQLMPTWWGHLGRKPTPREQDAIAARLWNGGAGRSHWVCA